MADLWDTKDAHIQKEKRPPFVEPFFSRPPWDHYFMDICKLTSQRSNCIRRKVGAVCVKDNRILSLGYNGTPRDTLNCFEGGCPRCNNFTIESGQSLETCLCLHAEENALLFVKKEDLEGSTL